MALKTKNINVSPQDRIKGYFLKCKGTEQDYHATTHILLVMSAACRQPKIVKLKTESFQHRAASASEKGTLALNIKILNYLDRKT